MALQVSSSKDGHKFAEDRKSSNQQLEADLNIVEAFIQSQQQQNHDLKAQLQSSELRCQQMEKEMQQLNQTVSHFKQMVPERHTLVNETAKLAQKVLQLTEANTQLQKV